MYCGMRYSININNRSGFIRLFSSSPSYNSNIINMKLINIIGDFVVYKNNEGYTAWKYHKTNTVIITESDLNNIEIFNNTIYNQVISEIPYIIIISLSNNDSEFYDIYINVYHYINNDADRSSDLKLLYDKIRDTISDFLLDPNKISSKYDLEIENNYDKVRLQFMTLEDEKTKDSNLNDGIVLLPPFGNDDDYDDDDNDDDDDDDDDGGG